MRSLSPVLVGSLTRVQISPGRTDPRPGLSQRRLGRRYGRAHQAQRRDGTAAAPQEARPTAHGDRLVETRDDENPGHDPRNCEARGTGRNLTSSARTPHGTSRSGGSQWEPGRGRPWPLLARRGRRESAEGKEHATVQRTRGFQLSADPWESRLDGPRLQWPERLHHRPNRLPGGGRNSGNAEFVRVLLLQLRRRISRRLRRPGYGSPSKWIAYVSIRCSPASITSTSWSYESRAIRGR